MSMTRDEAIAVMLDMASAWVAYHKHSLPPKEAEVEAAEFAEAKAALAEPVQKGIGGKP